MGRDSLTKSLAVVALGVAEDGVEVGDREPTSRARMARAIMISKSVNALLASP